MATRALEREFTSPGSSPLLDASLTLVPGDEEGGTKGRGRSLRSWFTNGAGGSCRDFNFEDVDPIIGVWLLTASIVIVMGGTGACIWGIVNW